MTPTAAELRELADRLENAGSFDDEAAACAALRALADEKEAALAGLTDALIEDCNQLMMKDMRMTIELNESGCICKVELRRGQMRAALESTALALQPDRERLNALVKDWRKRANEFDDSKNLILAGALDDCAFDLERALASLSDGGTT